MANYYVLTKSDYDGIQLEAQAQCDLSKDDTCDETTLDIAYAKHIALKKVLKMIDDRNEGFGQ